ncbi:MAG: ATP-binding cassette domain-containing protein, partial [Alphaproteobacteria bacterium]
MPAPRRPGRAQSRGACGFGQAGGHRARRRELRGGCRPGDDLPRAAMAARGGVVPTIGRAAGPRPTRGDRTGPCTSDGQHQTAPCPRRAAAHGQLPVDRHDELVGTRLSGAAGLCPAPAAVSYCPAAGGAARRRLAGLPAGGRLPARLHRPCRLGAAGRLSACRRRGLSPDRAGHRHCRRAGARPSRLHSDRHRPRLALSGPDQALGGFPAAARSGRPCRRGDPAAAARHRRGRLAILAFPSPLPREALDAGLMRIETCELVVLRGDHRAVDRVSLAIDGAGWTGLVGANGSGKTSLLRAIAGRLDADEGAILLDGADRTADRAWRAGAIGFAPDVAALPESLTGRELFAILGGAQVGLEPRDPLGALRSALAFDDFFDQRIFTLSAGMRQRLAIFCAFLTRPR